MKTVFRVVVSVEEREVLATGEVKVGAIATWQVVETDEAGDAVSIGQTLRAQGEKLARRLSKARTNVREVR